MDRKRVEDKRALACILLCGCIIALTGCGVQEDALKGTETAEIKQEEQMPEKDNETSAESEGIPALEGEGVSGSVDADNAADVDEENVKEVQELYEAQIRHYYGGVLSQIIAAWQLPDGELDTSSLAAGFGEMRDNHFAVTDIDGDGREELIVSYANATMAGMMAIIYDYDPMLGELKRELTEWPALTYYDNGIIKANASHNHSQGEFWPFVLYQYEAESDSYKQIAYVSTWDKEITSEWGEGQPFPDELDKDGDGTVFNICEGPEASYGYGDYQYDLVDFEAWYDGIMEGANEIPIDYQPMEYESFADFTPTYLKLLAGEAGKERTDKDADLGLMILNEDHFLEAAKTLLSGKYDVVIEQPEQDFEEYTVGLVADREVFTFTAMNAGDLSYSGEQVGDVTIFGIYPGISVDAAWETLKAYGFYAAPYGEVENCLITGEGFGNVSIWFSAEDHVVTEIAVRPYCAFAG